MPGISTSTMQSCGIGPRPTDVPQQIISPGTKVILRDSSTTISGGLNIISFAG